MNRTKGLKTVTGFKNMYEYNEKYVDAKAKFNMDRYNESNERQLKESFKCTFASDCRGFTDSLKGRVRISKVPDFIYLAMANAGIDEKKIEAIQCIMLYYEEKAVWPEYCSHIRVYPSAPERDVKRYFKTVSKDTRKELIALNTMLQKERLARYKFAVFFVKRVIRTFYFSSLPKYVSTHLYNKCPTCQQYYVEDSKSNSYKRVGGKKKIRNTLTENEAWMFVYDKLIRRGICMMI